MHHGQEHTARKLRILPGHSTASGPDGAQQQREGCIHVDGLPPSQYPGAPQRDLHEPGSKADRQAVVARMPKANLSQPQPLILSGGFNAAR
eukprot:3335769-Alexandrium_andersonii.AAC.1